jgi:hypothetical protein
MTEPNRPDPAVVPMLLLHNLLSTRIATDESYLEAVRDVSFQLGWEVENAPAFRSSYEGYALLLEKMDRLWSAVKSGCDGEAMHQPAVEVAAAAVRFLHDVSHEPEG